MNTEYLSYKNKSHHQSGLSQVELMIVVIIVGILASTAVLALHKSVKNACLQKATDRLISDLKQVRNRSRFEQKNYHFNFQPLSCSYTAPGVSASDSSNDISVNLGGDDYKISSMLCVLGGGTSVTFNSQGYATPSGNIILKSGNRKVTIYISPEGQIEQQN